MVIIVRWSIFSVPQLVTREIAFAERAGQVFRIEAERHDHQVGRRA